MAAHRFAHQHELFGRRRVDGNRAVKVALGGAAGQRHGQALHDLRRVGPDHVDADTDRVLAVHMAGADAPEIVQSLAVALTAGATKDHFDRTIAMHPTAAEEFVLMRTASRSLPAA